MLASLEPWQLVEWRAAIDVIGLDDSWEQTGVLAAELRDDIAAMSAAMGGGKPPTERTKPKDFIPLLRPEQQQQTSRRVLTPQEALAQQRMRIGV